MTKKNNKENEVLKTSQSSGDMSKLASGGAVHMPITKAAQYVGGSASTIFTQPMFFSPLHTPQNWQIASKRREVTQWARFYYENEPKAAAGVDFYANFPMNGFKLECKDRKVLAFFEHMVEKLDLDGWLRKISHEYYLIGDVFVFTEVECPVCNGTGERSDGMICNHPDGVIKRILVLNPDFVEVQRTQLADEPSVVLLPDDDLKKVVSQKRPLEVYNRIPENVKKMVMSGAPIPLSPRCVSHIKRKGAPYGTYGESLLRRLFTIISYKTKLMTANWIAAERHILPVRVVKVGSENRPASEADIADAQSQLASVANDPNLTIVTHHAFEMDFVGATGKIHDMSTQMEAIGKEMLDGLMLPQTLLNGEMAGYSCHDESTLTLTDSGFKRWDEINANDKIACYNPDTKELEYHNYIDKHVYDFNGEMVQFSTDKIDICVTPNHRMWSAKRDSDIFEFIEAKDVKPRASFVGVVQGFCGNSQDSFVIGDLEIPIYQYCELAGLFVSEGYTSKDKRRSGNRHTFSICQKENGKAFEKIEDCLDKTNMNYWINNNAFNVWSPCLADHFHEEYGHRSVNKKLPTWLKNLSPEYLEILLKAALAGDGYEHRHHGRKANNYVYCTSSKQLSEDIAEIAFKCGYSVKIVNRKSRISNKKYFNEKGYEIATRHAQYEVQISNGFKGRKPTLCSKSLKYANKEKTLVPYSGKVFCFTVPHGIFVTMRNGKIAIQGNSAAVGVETLIRRLETWRNELAQWVEKNIFLPVAQMQGFVDVFKSKLVGETVYLYPRLKWNDLNLRDNTSKLQNLMQLHDKGLISTQKLLEEFNIDYDTEINRLREEQITAGKGGSVIGGSGGGGDSGGGMPPLAGGGPPPDMGGGPPPDMGGGPPPDMGGAGGMPPLAGAEAPPAGGEAGGGAPPPAAGGLSSSAGVIPDKIYKKGKAPKAEKKDTHPSEQPKPVYLTKPEQKLYSILSRLKIPYRLFAQFKQNTPYSTSPYLLDFAYPEIGIDLEADGDFWHSDPESVSRDKQRDENLASMGWRVVRIKEHALNNSADEVEKIVYANIREAALERKQLNKKASSGKISIIDSELCTVYKPAEE
jgi:very-short-patch-repair endonuclease